MGHPKKHRQEGTCTKIDIFWNFCMGIPLGGLYDDASLLCHPNLLHMYAKFLLTHPSVCFHCFYFISFGNFFMLSPSRSIFYLRVRVDAYTHSTDLHFH